MIHLNKSQLRTKRAVGEILKATGLRQIEFAQRIGASLDTVKSWTRSKPAEMSRDFEWRILHATGAQIQPDGSVVMFIKSPNGKPDHKTGKYKGGLYNKPYSKKAFEFWQRFAIRSGIEGINYSIIESAKHSVEVILKAAATKGETMGMKFQFLAVRTSFDEWVEKTVQEFSLEKRIAAVEKMPAKPPRR
jgi:transcriptional regulator with XRE-family HTH domain